MTMTAAKEIQIKTHRTDGRYPGGYISNITAEDPWDKFSKIFKKYTHTIEYRGSDGYDVSNYNIGVYSKRSNRSGFTLNKPYPQVKEVEVYFRGTDDVDKTDPLILGFIYYDSDKSKTGCNASKCYYTWTHLKGKAKNSNRVIAPEGVIKEQDLVARLLEEIGNKIGRPDKRVINLDEQPDGSGGGGRTAYPDSGFLINKLGGMRVKVTKEEVTDVDGYDKYVHTITGIPGNEIYVAYQNNSRYFKTAEGSYLSSGKVTAYFEKGTNNLVLIVFTIKAGTPGAYVYRYTQFVSELQSVSAIDATDINTVKEISTSGGLQKIGSVDSYQESDLKVILPDERKKLKQLITFKQGTGTSVSNDNIKTQESEVSGTGVEKFKKVEMTFDTNSGNSTVYSDRLFDKQGGYKFDTSAAIPQEVLASVTTSRNNKYRCITVYYSKKSGSVYIEHNALLVQFDASDGRKIYIKRQDLGGNKWADASYEIGAGAVDAARLTGIARAAGIIDVGTRGTTQIKIETHRTQGSVPYDNGLVTVNVAAEDPWDKYSKIFKKYVHTIEYPEGAGGVYEKTKYTIWVFCKGTYKSGQSGFTLTNPDPQVKEVEVYFRGTDDVDNTEPLVVGLVYHDRDRGRTGCSTSTSDTCVKCYYTWTHLTTKARTKSGVIGKDGVIKEQDLVARLLEEIGGKINREEKRVINLDEQPGGSKVPGGGRSKYPDSGFFTTKFGDMRVNVTKRDVTGVQGYDKYEHTITGVSGTELYVTYKGNSRYFRTASGSFLGSATVTGYFEKATKELVLIVFTIKSGSGRGAYVYSYSQFVSELRQVTAIDATSSSTFKEISISGGLQKIGEASYEDSALNDILPEESKKLKQLITFEHGTGSSSNYNIKTSDEPNFGKDIFYQGYTFGKYTMTPDTSSGGQSKVYSGLLFTKELGVKIDTTATIPEEVLSYFTTSHSSVTNKYCCITVYYCLKDGSRDDYKALLVQFDASDGRKIYIKRTGTEGDKWAVSGEIVTVDASRLTVIARDARIIVVSTSGTKVIQINTNKTDGSNAFGHISNIAQENPWDRLSKIFKKYTHIIDYKGISGVKYIPAEYKINVYPRGSSSIGFTLKNPDPQVQKVELYFKGTVVDIKSTDPLILGFIYSSSDKSKTGCDTDKCYYTWTHLKKNSNNKNSVIGPEEVIREQDLVARLLEEIGGSIGRPNKLVIRLDERPDGSGDGGRSKYPESGKNSGKITVGNKQPVTLFDTGGDTKYEKYEHTVPTARDVSPDQLYVSYENDSRYIKVAERSGSTDKIDKVTAYFDTSIGSGSAGRGNTTNTKRLVLIVFTITGSTHGAYKYPYSEFVKDFYHVRADNATDSNTVKVITGGGGGLQRIGDASYQESDLSVTLKEEKEKLDKLITFEHGSGTSVSNQHIKTSQEEKVGTDTYKQGYTFMKYTMTPDKSSSSEGPWKVYSNKLFYKQGGDMIDTKATIPKEALTGITTTGGNYRCITVYYSTKDSINKALLVQFDAYDGRKIFIKRAGTDGNEWGIENFTDNIDNVKLTEIARDAGIIVVIDLAAVVGGPVAGIGGVGAGVGFAIYKYPQVFLSLIRR